MTVDQLRNTDLFYSGYPNGSSIRIEASFPGERVTYPPLNGSGENWYRFAVDIPASAESNAIAQISLIDDSSEWTGWGGLAYTEKTLLQNNAKDYLRFLLKMIVVVCLLLLPGWVFINDKRIKMHVGFLPLPGIAILSFAGLAFWIAPAPIAFVIRWTVYSTYLILFLQFLRLLTKRQWTYGLTADASHFCITVFLLTFVQASLFGINPLPVAQEFASGTSIPGRMIASPPDHAIPYQTSIYMYHGYDGKESSAPYFGTWNIGSRGPLVPLGINAIFHLANCKVDKVQMSERGESWPVDKAGIDLSKIYGWLLNSTVILGAFYLACALGVTIPRKKILLTWVAVSPLILINTVFLWPKLLAGYFVLLSIGLIIKGRLTAAGAMIALSWLSHPVGALMMPVIGLYSVLLPTYGIGRWKIIAKVKDGLRFAMGLLCFIAPWVIYKIWLGYQDIFLAYVFAGGQGTVPANSLLQWSAVRFSNFWLTLSPAAFFYADYMHNWIYGSLSEPLRWAIQSAKTLPGAIGMATYLIAFVALLTSRRDKPAVALMRSIVVIIGFLVMVIFWGFSSDGLGRNSLEPIALLLMILTVASKAPVTRWLRVVLWTVAAESLYVLFSGFVFAQGFQWSLVKLDAITLVVLNTFIFGVLVIYGTSFRIHLRRAPVDS